MGLLDGSPGDWLDLFRNSAQNQNLDAGIGADTAGQAPLGWQAPAQPPPLSLAGPQPPTPPQATSAQAHPGGPGIGDRLAAGFQSWAHTPVGNPMLGLTNGLTGFSTGQRADPDGARQAMLAQAARNGGASGGIDYGRLQSNLMASGDLEGAKAVADIAARNAIAAVNPGGGAARPARVAPLGGNVQGGSRFNGGKPVNPAIWGPVR